MVNIDKKRLSVLYKSDDISLLWNACQAKAIIDHPEEGKISPKDLRALYHQRPCPFCGKKMVHGSLHSTTSRSDALERKYQYVDKSGKKKINSVGGSSKRYFHPHYVTLDHRINKARCPELMFDYDNIQIMCWRCNNEKGDDNAYELKHSRAYIHDLSQEALERYPLI